MHLSVLYQESLQALAIRPDGCYVDCTFGRGGHSRGILAGLGENGRLLAIDRDIQAIESDHAKELLKDKRFSLHHGCFSELADVIGQAGLAGYIDGVLMDLGVSSPQLDDAERGFSFMREGPLDMRMNNTEGLTAAEWLAQVQEKDLARVLSEYGEERFAKRIAAAIVRQWQQQPLTTTLQLARLIEDAVPFRDKHKHPATRTFQALRIAVNSELEEVQKGLPQAMGILASGGRLVVISFHSLEDRIVKRFIRQESGRKFNPGRLPVQEADIAQGCLRKIGKAVRAGPDEVQRNPRARSAVMRVAEKR